MRQTRLDGNHPANQTRRKRVDWHLGRLDQKKYTVKSRKEKLKSDP
jgi:hypothetical protein